MECIWVSIHSKSPESMTSHYFNHPRVKIHYYKYGLGDQYMLCFHGFGMHGKQFQDLEDFLGSTYTLIGFDLFFHKKTKLTDNSLKEIQKGIGKQELVDIIRAFCYSEKIDRFSLLGYSMGSHYATVLAEGLPERIDHYILAAPASIQPTPLVRFFSKTWVGNSLLRYILFHKTALDQILKGLKGLGVLDQKNYEIIQAEVKTEELRKDMYANFTYLRHFDTDENRLIQAIRDFEIKTIFFFGEFDKNYPLKIGDSFFRKLKPQNIILLPTGHELINSDFARSLSQILV
jgi:pimeloyl-ACP methyl ester carboxylesterase